MKTIKLQVTIEVPDNYQMDKPEWTLENAVSANNEEHIVGVASIDSAV